jgi:hypothetical protein
LDCGVRVCVRQQRRRARFRALGDYARRTHALQPQHATRLLILGPYLLLRGGQRARVAAECLAAHAQQRAVGCAHGAVCHGPGAAAQSAARCLSAQLNRARNRASATGT